MNLSKYKIFLIIFSILYILAFTIYYISIKDYEFLWYIAVLVFLFLLIGFTLNRTKLDNLTLTGLSLWGLLHMAGGGVRVNGAVLYRYIIFPIIDKGDDFLIFKFDQFVHFFGFGVCALLVFALISPQLKNRYNKYLIYFIAVIGSLGLSAINEIVEFAAVVVFPSTGVGGYYNTALDLVFNALGALTGAVILYFRDKIR